MKTLEIKNLHVNVEDKEILKGVDLTVRENEIHALMGPNGNGKSTLLAAIMGNPKFEVTEGVFDQQGQWKEGRWLNGDEIQLRYDLLYLDNMSLTTDLKILLYTVMIIIQGRGK